MSHVRGTRNEYSDKPEYFEVFKARLLRDYKNGPTRCWVRKGSEVYGWLNPADRFDLSKDGRMSETGDRFSGYLGGLVIDDDAKENVDFERI